MTWRNLELAPARFMRWWDKFHTDHPGVSTRYEGGKVHLESENGSQAVFTGWYPVEPGVDPRKQLLAAPAWVAIILIRRGGFSVGVAREVGESRYELESHKTGTRYVQGRTAAGGWSQQRFARRRDNQANELVGACADHTARVLHEFLASHEPSRGLAVGGDSNLISEVLQGPRLREAKELARREFTDVPDPRFAVLEDVAGRLGFVRVAVRNP